MLFKKKKQDNNMITDDEVMVSEDKAKEKSKFNFTWPFGKNKKVEEKQEEKKEDEISDNSNNNTMNNQGVDFNYTFMNNNNNIPKKKKPNIIGFFVDLIIIAAIIYFVIWSGPKIVNWFTDGRENYVDLAKSMAVQVKEYYFQEGQKCTTTVNHRYFFNIYNSKEQFGDKYVSPIDKQPMEGSIELEVYSNSYTIYVTLTDGFFGINHVKLEELDKGDIKIFTFLGLESNPEMKCDKRFEISNQ